MGRFAGVVCAVALVAGCLAVPGVAVARPAKGKAEVASIRPQSDIAVEVILANGNRISYSSEVRQVQLVLDGSGQIRTVHLILAIGTETNTHEWYNFENLAGFSYRYIEITGRAKVSVVRTQEVQGLTEVQDKVPVLRPENYQ